MWRTSRLMHCYVYGNELKPASVEMGHMSGVGMDTTLKVSLALILLSIGGFCVLAGAPVFNVLPQGLANAIALACLLCAILILCVPPKR